MFNNATVIVTFKERLYIYIYLFQIISRIIQGIPTCPTDIVEHFVCMGRFVYLRAMIQTITMSELGRRPLTVIYMTFPGYSCFFFILLPKAWAWAILFSHLQDITVQNRKIKTHYWVLHLLIHRHALDFFLSSVSLSVCQIAGAGLASPCRGLLWPQIFFFKYSFYMFLKMSAFFLMNVALNSFMNSSLLGSE